MATENCKSKEKINFWLASLDGLILVKYNLIKYMLLMQQESLDKIIHTAFANVTEKWWYYNRNINI